MAVGAVVATDLFPVEKKNLPFARQISEHGGAITGLGGRGLPAHLPGASIKGRNRARPTGRLLRAGIDYHELIVNKRRTTHSPREICISFENVGGPLYVTRAQIQTTENPRGAERKDIAAIDRRRRSGAVAAEFLLKECRVGVHPALAPRVRVVTND